MFARNILRPLRSKSTQPFAARNFSYGEFQYRQNTNQFLVFNALKYGETTQPQLNLSGN